MGGWCDEGLDCCDEGSSGVGGDGWIGSDGVAVDRLQRRSSANILTAWPGRVAQAPRAGRARAPWSCSPCWRPRREPHGSGTSYSSTTKRTRKSPTATPRAAHCSARRGVAVGDLPTSSVSAVQLVPETLCSARTHPVKRTILQIVDWNEKDRNEAGRNLNSNGNAENIK